MRLQRLSRVGRTLKSPPPPPPPFQGKWYDPLVEVSGEPVSYDSLFFFLNLFIFFSGLVFEVLSVNAEDGTTPKGGGLSQS